MTKHRKVAGAKGFTLIELLTVIAMIGILMGLLLEGLNAVKEGARRRKAAGYAATIAHAMKTYRIDYTCWPGANRDTDVTYTIAEVNQMVIDLEENPRKILYIELPPGFYDTTNGLIDPWKRSFVVATDNDGDGITRIETSAGQVEVRDSVAIMSYGAKPENTNKWVWSCK